MPLFLRNGIPCCVSRLPLRPFSTLVRLSKRMSELDLCSRREADRLLESGRVLVQGTPAILGQKVHPQESRIQIVVADTPSSSGVEQKTSLFPKAVVLHKPVDFVSAQPEDGHVPAVKLLTRSNYHHYSNNNNNNNSNNNKNAFGGEGAALDDLFETSDERETLKGYALAGRLDKASSGLLIFCHSGVVAKKLVSSMGLIEKEYVVEVELANQPTKRERELGIERLPRHTMDLSVLERGGGCLAGDDRPLRPIRASWIYPGETLQMILNEGRKHQIRRMCRELLGFHVVGLQRTRIGPVHVGDLPVGNWRPLTDEEIENIVGTNSNKKRVSKIDKKGAKKKRTFRTEPPKKAKSHRR